MHSQMRTQNITLLHLLDQCLGEGAPCMHAGSGSSRGGWRHATVPCKLARGPGWSSCPLSRFRRNVNNGTHWFLQSWLFPQLLESSHGILTFSTWSLSLPCYAQAVQLAHSCLSGGFALNIGIHLMYSYEGESSESTYASILDHSWS